MQFSVVFQTIQSLTTYHLPVLIRHVLRMKHPAIGQNLATQYQNERQSLGTTCSGTEHRACRTW